MATFTFSKELADFIHFLKSASCAVRSAIAKDELHEHLLQKELELIQDFNLRRKMPLSNNNSLKKYPVYGSKI